MKSIKELKNLKGKKVIVRVDFNVPIVYGKARPNDRPVGRVEDDFRIKKALPTLNYLLNKGASLLLITHLGKDGSESLNEVIKQFYKVAKLSKEQKSRIEFFDNIRKFEGEEKNNKDFAKELAKKGDIYVNDAFSVSHRAHASVVGIPKYLPHYAGLQLAEEIKHLSVPFKNPKHPFLFILGGAKFSTKMPLIKKYLKLADFVFIGGALLNDILETEGFEVGKSLVDESVSLPKSMLKNKKLLLPLDVLVKSGNNLINKNIEDIAKDDVILDNGAESTKLLASVVKKSKLILWNGPLGKYEDGGDKATKIILKEIAKTKATSIIGGGDTVELISLLKMRDKFTFVSTGGGATLDFLANGTLPGIKALK